MRNYETVFIINPVLSTEQIKETANKYEELLEANSCTIVNKENWGLRKLAYPIQKKTSGFYKLIEFQTENGNFISELELQLKRDERILRFLTVKLDKSAVEWARERQKRISNIKNKKVEENESK